MTAMLTGKYLILSFDLHKARGFPRDFSSGSTPYSVVTIFQNMAAFNEVLHVIFQKKKNISEENFALLTFLIYCVMYM